MAMLKTMGEVVGGREVDNDTLTHVGQARAGNGGLATVCG